MEQRASICLAGTPDDFMSLWHGTFHDLLRRGAQQETAPVEPIGVVVNALGIGGVVQVHQSGDTKLLGYGSLVIFRFKNHVERRCQGLERLIMRVHSLTAGLADDGPPHHIAHIVEIEFIVHIVLTTRIVGQRAAVHLGMQPAERAPQPAVGNDILIISCHRQHHIAPHAVVQVPQPGRLVPHLCQAQGNPQIELVGHLHLGIGGLPLHIVFYSDFHLLKIVFLP